jgi:nitrogen fixation protein FixH
MPAWMIILVLFMGVVGIANGIFVWLSSHGHRDLVREDYYAAGLKQDGVIARNAAAGSVSLRRDGSDWLLEAAPTAVSATGCRLRFYRPDDGRADRTVTMRRAAGAADRETWRGPAAEMRRGQWIVTAIWDREGVDVSEKSLHLTEP